MNDCRIDDLLSVNLPYKNLNGNHTKVACTGCTVILKNLASNLDAFDVKLSI